MPDRFADAILKYLSDRDYQPLKPRQLARVMGVADEDYGTFRQAVKQLHGEGRIVLGAKDSMMLPGIPARLVGIFRSNPRGFGFVIPETPNAHGDLFVPPDATGGAVTGDRVMARVHSRGKREGKDSYGGEIIEILQRGKNRFVGELQQTQGTWFVLPDGTQMTSPIVIRDLGVGAKAGTKVVAEIVTYGKTPAELPTGVIVETLGVKGQLAVETLSVIRAHGLADQFSDAAMDDARAAIARFNPDQPSPAHRKDLTDLLIVTIDPPDARDFDDAISLTTDRNGLMTLGIHIADVAHFVVEGGDLDKEAAQRGTSVYFPQRVVPMLPEILSNGVCSLQEGQKRYCQTAFITYDKDAAVVSTRFCDSVIKSHKRLTYQQAQHICDGRVGGFDPQIVGLLKDMEQLARRIEQRRFRAGMIHLDLPDVELVLDDQQRIVDAVPEDTAYSHTMIEMFMVEANEAVANAIDSQNRLFLRRIHPNPDQVGGKQLSMFVKACGHKLPPNPTPREIQSLLAAVRGKPESYAVNLAVLKTFEQAEYSPMRVGHFALASTNYCHFTSPIRRYPDLTIHRQMTRYNAATLANEPPDDMSQWVRLGENCSAAERRAQAAEYELREVLILQLLQDKVGEGFAGVITGMTNFGMFVQSPKFLIDGLLRLQDLGDDWWELTANRGEIRGQVSGRTYRIGDIIAVQIASVDIARRQLNLVLDRGARDLRGGPRKPPQAAHPKSPKGRPGGKGGKAKPAGKGGRRGKRRR